MSRSFHLPSRSLSIGILALSAVAVFAAGSARKPLSRVAPVYPELARRMHITGTVILHLTIQPDGSVSDARVESGHALLGPAAQEAVKRWKFEPSADTSDITVDVNFSDH